MRHDITIQLHRIIKCDVEVENPHKKGFKKFLRDLFPKTEEKTYVIPVKYVSFEKIEEVFSTPVEVNGKTYLKTSESEPYDAGEGWVSYRPLYILTDDFDNIIHGNYYPYISVKEKVTNEN